MTGPAPAAGPGDATRPAAAPAAIVVSKGDKFLTAEIVVKEAPAKAVGAATPAAPQGSLLRRAWERWKKIAHAIGRFQTMVLMSVLYFTIIPIFSLIKIKDPLRIRKAVDPTRPSYWEDRGEHGKPQPLERHFSPF